MTVNTTLFQQRPSSDCIDCRGASVSVETRGPTTVITVSGEIDASNADFMATVLNGFATGKGPVVVDLSGIDFVGTQGLRVLLGFDDQCRRGGVAWALVPCRIMRRLLQVFSVERQLPLADSVDDAVDPFERSVTSDDHRLPRVTPDKLRC